MEYNMADINESRTIIEGAREIPNEVLDLAKSIKPPEDDEIMSDDMKKYDGQQIDELNSSIKTFLFSLRSLISSMEKAESMNSQLLGGTSFGVLGMDLSLENGLKYTENVWEQGRYGEIGVNSPVDDKYRIDRIAVLHGDKLVLNENLDSEKYKNKTIDEIKNMVAKENGISADELKCSFHVSSVGENDQLNAKGWVSSDKVSIPKTQTVQSIKESTTNLSGDALDELIKSVRDEAKKRIDGAQLGTNYDGDIVIKSNVQGEKLDELIKNVRNETKKRIDGAQLGTNYDGDIVIKSNGKEKNIDDVLKDIRDEVKKRVDGAQLGTNYDEKNNEQEDNLDKLLKNIKDEVKKRVDGGQIGTVFDGDIIIKSSDQKDKEAKHDSGSGSVKEKLYELGTFDYDNFVGPLPKGEKEFFENKELQNKLKVMGIPNSIIHVQNTDEKGKEYKYASYDVSSKKLTIDNLVNINTKGGVDNVTFNLDGKEQKNDDSVKILLDNDVINYTDLLEIKDIKKNENTRNIKFFDDTTIDVLKGTKNSFVLENDSEGNIQHGHYLNENGKLEDIKIFADYANDNVQFGGNQDDFKNQIEELVANELIMDNIGDSFGLGDNTDDIKENYIRSLSSLTCGFVAEINGLFEHFEGKEGEFKEKYGYDMYKIDNDGNIVFNYEYPIIQYFNYVFSNKADFSMQDIYNKKAATSIGFSPAVGELFEDFCKDVYDLDVEYTQYTDGMWNASYKNTMTRYASNENWPVTTNSNKVYETCKELLEQGHDHVKIGSTPCRLNDYETGNTRDCSGHQVQVVGVEDGNLIVSSFGRKYIYDIGRNSGCMVNISTTDFE